MLHSLLVRQLKRVGLDAESPPADASAWRALLERITNAYHDADQERYLLERSLALSSSEMRDALDKAHATNRDLEASRNALESSQREAEEAWAAAEAASRAKSEFLANMSHEIRTPMTAILGFTDILLDSVGADDTTDIASAARTIKRNGEHLLNLINDILDLSKIEAGKMTLDVRRCSPHEIAREVVALFQVRAESKGLTMQLEYSGKTPEYIQTDSIRLRQILMNLVGNALKFTEVGSVRIIMHYDGFVEPPMLHFDVVDTGIGLTMEEALRLFKPFSQVDQSVTRRFGGTGLGLIISQRFARMLQGDVSIVESAPGKGTRFRASVATGPLDGVAFIEGPTAAGPMSMPRQPLAGPESKLPPCRILYAEDGPDNQRLISHILIKAGADVTIVENGRLACEAVDEGTRRGGEFDVILMDMQMPVLDGYSATRHIRHQGYTGPIVALTAHAMAGDEEKCLACGCDIFLAKPVKRQLLIDTIRRLVTPVDDSGPEHGFQTGSTRRPELSLAKI